MNELTPQQKSSHTISDRVLERIHTEAITPSPKWLFWCSDMMVWVLWVLTVLAGAIAVSIMLYVAHHARYALYEATHETWFLFFVEVLPYIWVSFFIVMASLAYFNLRHTKHGYRYPMWFLLVSSMAGSIVGGFILSLFSVGYLMDTVMQNTMSTYPSLERAEMRMWQMPSEGRLVGIFSDVDPNAEATVTFIDTHNETWSVNIRELKIEDRELLEYEGSVRLLGTTTDMVRRLFHACGIFPWMYDRVMNTNDLKQDRELFVQQLLGYNKAAQRERLNVAEKVTNTNLSETELCGNLKAFQRIQIAQ